MKQNEIWLINLDPTLGAEIKKTRPALIVNDDALGKLPLKVVVPLTDWKSKYEVAPWMVKVTPNNINNLSKPSSADCFQVRSVSEERFVKKIGEIDFEISESVKVALSKVFSIHI
ncbi:type II toxin-antitoxin system PemK/MazF family toxin [Marivirga salinae]|uniref:mRNA interferase n=1 Tax=Marivirga salinarum TaxID=3059078 RepID=A0AA49GCN3_9BACT|nr:type II toxin-antitoxin system PemK/MazF family toxin [Marivirga sp. BDSF4-3]WKK77660.2 type II toxin-antitoxin system PemK/MazF family toxin [Marivirga sp. BDSF4-3]